MTLGQMVFKEKWQYVVPDGCLRSKVTHICTLSNKYISAGSVIIIPIHLIGFLCDGKLQYTGSPRKTGTIKKVIVHILYKFSIMLIYIQNVGGNTTETLLIL